MEGCSRKSLSLGEDVTVKKVTDKGRDGSIKKEKEITGIYLY